MPDTVYTPADVAKQVLVKDAHWFIRDGAPLALNDDLTRYWNVVPHLREHVRSFLDLYGDGDHYADPVLPATVAAECHAISGPLADGCAQAGLYRVVRNYEDPQFPGWILQLLRRGWISGLVSGTAGVEVVDWSEARLGSGETGSVLPAPAGAGVGATCQRRVLNISWPCVDPTKLRGIVASMMALTPGHAAWQAATIRGEALGTGWVRLGVADHLADDGSGVIELVLAKAEAVFEFVSKAGTTSETRETVVHGVPANLVQTYADGWRKYGALSTAGTVPRGGSVSGSVEPSSGQALMSFSWKSGGAKGAQIMGIFVNENNWQLHFRAWNQPGANLAGYIVANPVGFGDVQKTALGGTDTWRVGVVMTWPVAPQWTLAEFDYDEETDLYSWHVIWRPNPEAYYDGLVRYTSTWTSRNFWRPDEENQDVLALHPQVLGTLYAHTWKLCSTLAEAWSWRAGSVLLDTPDPRQVGDKWLAMQSTVQSCTGWVNMDNEEQAFNFAGWAAPNDYNLTRFGITLPESVRRRMTQSKPDGGG